MALTLPVVVSSFSVLSSSESCSLELVVLVSSCSSASLGSPEEPSSVVETLSSSVFAAVVSPACSLASSLASLLASSLASSIASSLVLISSAVSSRGRLSAEVVVSVVDAASSPRPSRNWVLLTLPRAGEFACSILFAALRVLSWGATPRADTDGPGALC